jgi:DNA-entry nuclease
MRRRNRKSLLIALVPLFLLIGKIVSTQKDDGVPKLTPFDNQKQTEKQVDEKEVENKQETSSESPEANTETTQEATAFDYNLLPAYSGEAYTVVNDNKPYFYPDYMVPKTYTSYATYGDLDQLGRCTETFAIIGKDIMPTEPRGSIKDVKPTGWKIGKYDFVNGKYLYNRCHLIGYQLTGENANPKNLITGTRYLNVDGMLPFENLIAGYLKSNSQAHVAYRVTPIFIGNELVARGVLMEAMSLEDSGESVMFNVFCYNVQPGVEIDYNTGDNWLAN